MKQQESTPHPAAKRRPSPLARLGRAARQGWQRSTLPASGLKLVKWTANGLVMLLVMLSVVVIDITATLARALCRLFGEREIRNTGHHAR